jgi:hypothetical protein
MTQHEFIACAPVQKHIAKSADKGLMDAEQSLIEDQGDQRGPQRG